MASKIYPTLLSLAVLVTLALSQCIGGPWPCNALSPFDMRYSSSWPAVGCGDESLGPGFATAAGYKGGLSFSRASPIRPTGLIVRLENTIDGVVAVTGQLPFLGAVATDGIFQTVGAGDGSIGIMAAASVAPAAVSPAFRYGSVLGGGVLYNHRFTGLVSYGGCGY